ncbi:MAG: gliding motility-associated C-terminal domain-containing protein, partial [Crocinitomicaceae bacterium]
WFPIIRNSKTMEYSIYNRWGERIMTSSEIPWDGKFKGMECPMGVYTYIIDYTDKNNMANQVNGFINLIR